MKIVTWNMKFGGREATWRYLVEEIAPDLALLQEARPPSKYADKSLIYQRIPMDNYMWGSAIYSPKLLVGERPVAGHEGWVVAGEVTLPDGIEVVVVSIYASQLDGPKRDSVFPNLNNIFQRDLQPLLEGRNFITGTSS